MLFNINSINYTTIIKKDYYNKHIFFQIVYNFFMKQHKLSLLIDNLFLIISIFIISFLWVRYYEHNSFFILLFSSLITFALCSIIALVKNKKNSKTLSKKTRLNCIENMSKKLMFQSQKQTLYFFEYVLQHKNIKYEIYGNFIRFESTLIYPLFSKLECNANDIIETIIDTNSQNIVFNKIIIVSNSYTNDAVKISKLYNKKVMLLNKEETFSTFFEPINYVFENNSQKHNKVSFKEKISNLTQIAFNKSRTKSYVLSSIILIIGSYFMRYNIYYLCFATLLIFFALFSQFNKPFNTKQESIFANESDTQNDLQITTKTTTKNKNKTPQKSQRNNNKIKK